jgi:hypothetical protein
MRLLSLSCSFSVSADHVLLLMAGGWFQYHGWLETRMGGPSQDENPIRNLIRNLSKILSIVGFWYDSCSKS